MTLKEITDEALKLPTKDRAELVYVRIRSLDSEPEEPSPEHERLWREEIERRYREIKDGTVRLIPGDEAFARVRQALREGRTSIE